MTFSSINKGTRLILIDKNNDYGLMGVNIIKRELMNDYDTYYFPRKICVDETFYMLTKHDHEKNVVYYKEFSEKDLFDADPL